MNFEKKMLIAVFSAFLLVATLTNLETASSSTTAILSLDPTIVYKAVGESFKVNVTVSGAEFLFAWQMNMSFNSDVLNFVNVTEGDFLAWQPDGTFGTQKVQESSMLFGWSTIGEYQGISGSGVLATVEFEVVAEGESLLKFETDQIYVNATGTWIYLTYLTAQNSPNPPPDFDDLEFTAQNGLFINTLTPPVADFTYSPDPPGIDQPITFNASASSATSPLEIAEYYWDFGDGTNASVTTATTEYTYTTGGVFTASLTVIDDATASALVQSQFNTTDMPRIWYELFSTKEVTLSIAYAHDVAVTNVAVSKTVVNAGETVSIDVTVRNDGTESEDFSVTTYYGTNTIDTQQVDGLSPGSEETLTFSWDTTGVAEGDYQIKAIASTVEGEVDTDDNEFKDGTVTVNVVSEPFPTTLVIGGAIGVIIVLAVVIFYMRRKRT